MTSLVPQGISRQELKTRAKPLARKAELVGGIPTPLKNDGVRPLG